MNGCDLNTRFQPVQGLRPCAQIDRNSQAIKTDGLKERRYQLKPLSETVQSSLRAKQKPPPITFSL